MWKLNPRFMQACLELTRDPCWHYCGCAASTPLPCITAAALHIMLSLSNSFPCYLGCLQGTTQTYRQAFVLIKLVHMHVTCFLSLFEVVKHVWDHSKLDDMLFLCVHAFQSDKAERVEVYEMLRTMLEFEQKDTRKDPARIAVVAHCLAMLSFLGGDFLKVSHLVRY